MSDDGNSTQNFLRQIDPGLAKYASEFKKCDVSNLNTLRYLLPSEVNSMEMPQVYKRMVIDKIINMQTPETKSAFKKKMKADAGTAASHPPKRLKFENTVSSPGIDVTDAAKSDSGICGSTQNDSYLKKKLGRLRDEKETLVILLSHKI
ncbi:uncharacterized protein LOC132561329 [Ylistrum balloti]|uniref:uncharacterized protein LOC132561329 n=1 Tax=Ylistrum balloti TaxID=509963 RepID=UPI002905C6CC|nr:uncharacterized protein LOC132561329 [Ylistrum balloti]